jgi:hypothetical protein
MKNLRYVVLAALVTPAMAADPDTLKQYDMLQQAFYKFDPHAYKSFTCHVDVSSVDATVANVKQMLAPHADSLQMKDDLAGYSLTVDNSVGLSINNPTLDIVVLNEKGMTDPVKVRLGIDQTKQGFQTQVQGVDQVISGVFNGYLDTVPNLTSVSHDGKTWVVKYVEGGIATTDTIEGSHLHEDANANGVNIVSDSDFTPVGGSKLGLQSSNIQMSQGTQNVVTTITVNYQKLGVLQVPASIVTKTALTMPGLSQTTMANTITMQNCSIKE